MSRFVILLGGELVRTPRLDAQVAGAASSRPMPACAMPRRWAHAGTLGRRLRFRDRRNCRRMCRRCRAGPFPPDKDKTDGELAVAEALERGATSLVLAGAFGGPRADHAFLHLALAIRLRRGRSAGAADQRHAGRPTRCCRARAISTSMTARCSRSSASPHLSGVTRDGREMAARLRRGALRLVAHHVQRGARRSQDLARQSAARCCSPIPIPARTTNPPWPLRS